MSEWYKKAQEYVNVDRFMSPIDINRTRELKQWPIGGAQGAPSVTHKGLGLSSDGDDKDFGIKVEKCGEEPGRGGCGRSLNEYGQFLNYSIPINGEKYQAYKCKHCHHTLKPFDIRISPKPLKYKSKLKKKRKRKKLSKSITYSMPIKEAATPGINSPSSMGHNPANSPYGRMDLSEDYRVIPWDQFVDSDDEKIYNDWSQKNNKNIKVVKVKMDGKTKYIKVLDKSTGGSGVTPANTYRIKGDRMQHFRYDPAKGKNKNDGYGSWPHNRDVNKGWYQSPENDNMNADLRMRVIPWDQYIRDRSTNLLTLTRPS